MKYYLRTDIYFDSKAFSSCDLHYEEQALMRGTWWKEWWIYYQWKASQLSQRTLAVFTSCCTIVFL